MRVMNNMKKATAWTGLSNATVEQLSQSSAFKSVLLYFSDISSMVLYLWAQPSTFSSSVPKTTPSPSLLAEAFLLPGSQGAAEHMLHISTTSSSKGIHSSTEFTCHLQTYPGQCSNLWLHKNHHPTLRKPRTSMPYSDPTVLPKQIPNIHWMLHFLSPALTHHLYQLLVATKHTNYRSLPKRAVCWMWLSFKVARFTYPCCPCN